MGLIRTAIVFGAGYLVGRPDGLEQLEKLRGQVVTLANRPEVRKVREQAWDIAGDQALAVKRRLPRRSPSDDGSPEVPVARSRGWRPGSHSASVPVVAEPALTEEPLAAGGVTPPQQPD
ncbi:hypothetical protein [Pseudonocardia pini]|uniref:hypothetical protein n=1 Tax=Pseudonocardia pini TaxID=2758030 RepID=UPI0015EFF59B|nr:hypothetical protein [Pseudonocardia pini]